MSSSSTATTYHTHMNGGRPYTVKVDRKAKRVTVFDRRGKEVVRIEHCAKIFTGSSVANTGAVLVCIDPENFEYVYIGDTVERYTFSEEIESFKPEIGNSDVVYAYAMGHKNVYLFAERSMFPRSKLTVKDPYKRLYGHDGAEAIDDKYVKKITSKRLHAYAWDADSSEDEAPPARARKASSNRRSRSPPKRRSSRTPSPRVRR